MGVTALDDASLSNLTQGRALPLAIVGGARSGTVKLLDLQHSCGSSGGNGGGGGGGGGDAARDLSSLRPHARAAAEAAAEAIARENGSARECVGALKFDCPPRPGTGGTWQPAWGEALQPANVVGVVAMGARISGRRLLPERVAAAVRNDVCVWHMIRPD